MEAVLGDWVYSVTRNADGSFSGERWPIDDKNNKEQLTRLEELPEEVRKLFFGKSNGQEDDERVERQLQAEQARGHIHTSHGSDKKDPVNGSLQSRIDPH